jgi:hypothetical protein
MLAYMQLCFGSMHHGCELLSSTTLTNILHAAYFASIRLELNSPLSIPFTAALQNSTACRRCTVVLL